MRAFIAATLSSDARATLAAYQDTLKHTIVDGVRWTPAEQLHITLRFMGECAPETVTPLRTLVRRVASETPPIQAAWQPTADAFPHRQSPRILWAGLTTGEDGVTLLARHVEAGVVALGFPPETRAFHAHVTLGRVDGLARTIGRRLDAAAARLPETPWLLQTVALIDSRLLPQGAIHTVMEEAELQGGV